MTVVSESDGLYYRHDNLRMAFATRVEAFEYGSQKERLEMVSSGKKWEDVENRLREGSESEESTDEVE